MSAVAYEDDYTDPAEEAFDRLLNDADENGWTAADDFPGWVTPEQADQVLATLREQRLDEMSWTARAEGWRSPADAPDSIDRADAAEAIARATHRHGPPHLVDVTARRGTPDPAAAKAASEETTRT